MKVLVSSCIMGKNCKYNGGNNLNPKVVEFLKDKEVNRNLSRIISEYAYTTS